MKINVITSIIVLTLLISGCTSSPKSMWASGGSKADGTVDLSYNYGLFEKPEVDWQAALMTAQQKCKAWGYKNAEPFGGQQENCQDEDCWQKLVTVTYQCID